MTWWRGVRGSAPDRGAAAVEFALVMPLFLLLVMGILDYGRFWYDSAGLRQGAREAARQAVVQTYGGCTLGNAGAKTACSAKAASDLTIGIPMVRIVAPAPWVQGGRLLVCMKSTEQGTGFVPMPSGGILKTKVYMSIEVDSPPPVSPSYSLDDSGGDWTWCT